MLRRVAGWVAIWMVAMVTYLLFAVSLAPEELAFGAVAATVALVAIGVVVRHDPARLRLVLALRWLAGAWRVPWQVLIDTVRLAAALWGHAALGRPVRGRFLTVPFPDGEPDDVATTRRVLVTTLTSLTPNTYVVGIEDGHALLHRLLPDRADPIAPGLLAPVAARGRARA